MLACQLERISAGFVGDGDPGHAALPPNRSITEDQQFLVRASFLEIYNEEIRDLLAKNPKNRLELKENQDGAVYVKDLTSFVVKSVTEIGKVLEVGNKNRRAT